MTPRLIIEPLALSDAEAFANYRRDPLIARFQSWDTTYSLEQANRLVESQAGVAIPGPGEWVQLAIRDRTEPTLFGDLALHTVADSPTTFEIGFTVAREFQGNGIATEAASRLLTFLFADCGARLVCAHSDRRNAASIALLERLGFSHIPEKSWTESFKGETVVVDTFELIPNDTHSTNADH